MTMPQRLGRTVDCYCIDPRHLGIRVSIDARRAEADARAGQGRHLIVAKLDRLSRFSSGSR